jgi:hypothetical protein
VLGHERQTVEEATGTLDPAAGDGGFAAKGVGVLGQPEGDAGRSDLVAVAAAEAVGSETESFEGFGGFLARDHPFEAVAGFLPRTAGECGVAGGEGIVWSGDGSFRHRRQTPLGV